MSRTTLKRSLIRALDRLCGRGLLAALATRSARRITGADLAIDYDGVWFHRGGDGVAVPHGPRFDFYPVKFPQLLLQAQRDKANARDWWLRHGVLGAGGIVVDIGAGRGEDALAFAEAVGPTGRLLAIEAHPSSFAMLGHFIRMNRLMNATPLNVAVMDAPGVVTLSDSEDWVDNAITGEGSVSVPALTLPAICASQGITRIEFLKLNIEGAERPALLGMEDMMAAVGAICVACHDFRAERGDGEQYRTRRFVEEYLTRHGFRLASRPDHPEPHVRDHIFGLRGR